MNPVVSRRIPARPGLLAGVLLAAVLLAVWMDLSPVHRHHNADSIVPVLTSLYHWTPFYWGQDRFGMLVPLLALPVESPFGNLLVQTALRIGAVLLAFFLLARAVVPRDYWPAVGASTLALFLGGKDLAGHSFMYMQPYGQSIALSLGGILLLERRGGPFPVAAGVALLCLGSWVAATDLLWLLPLLVLRSVLAAEDRSDRPWLRRLVPDRRTLGLLAAAVAACALSLLFSRLAPYRMTSFGLVRPADWLPAWRGLLEKGAAYLTPWLPLALGILLASLAAVSLRGGRAAPAARRALAAGCVLLGAALAQLASLGTTRWLQLNQLSFRYLAPGFLLTATAFSAMVLIAALEGRDARWHRAANALALTVLLGIVAFRYGPPSVSRARNALDAGPGRDSRALVAAGATHVIGDYWRVWPAVYHANLVRWERGERRPVWGITFRAMTTRPLWWPQDWSGARIASFPGDRWADHYRKGYGLPRLYPEGLVGAVWVYSTVPPPSSDDSILVAGTRRSAG